MQLRSVALMTMLTCSILVASLAAEAQQATQVSRSVGSILACPTLSPIPLWKLSGRGYASSAMWRASTIQDIIYSYIHG